MQKIRVACAVVVLACLARSASAVTLYDGAAGTAPETQGWLSYYSLPGTGTKATASGKTTYDASANLSERGGFSSHSIIGVPVNASFPVLDRTAGFTVSIDMKLLSESHASTDRAGLSLIVLSSDHQGIELGFWPTEIWAQSGPTFTHAEGQAYDPTAASKTYDLTIQGSTYTLNGNGLQILTGSLRDYSSFGLPYNLTNYIFLGDNTTSAGGAFEFSRLAIVPEPGVAFAVGALALLLRRR